MTTEQKAKAYDEAIERAKEVIRKMNMYDGTCIKEDIEDIFPQLAENDDERIRKWLVDYFKAVGNSWIHRDISCEQILAYLEKQKEEEGYEAIPVESTLEYKLGFKAGKESEKQKEQKHPDGCFTCDEYKKGYEEGRRNGFTAGYNKAMKEQKPAQTDDEKEYIRTIKSLISDFIRDKQPEDVAFYQTIYDWLDGRHIEQKPEGKPINWTELTWKDIVELEGIINNVHYEFRNGIGQESFGKEVLEKFREYKGEYLDEIEQKPVEGTALQKAFISSKIDYTLEEKCDASDYAEAILPTSVVYGENEEEYKLHKIIEAAFIAGQKKEQNPTEWSDTNELVFKDICKHLKEEGYNGWIVLLEALRNGEFQPKQKWSEEDEKMKKTSISFLKDFADTGWENAVECIDWLKSLPLRCPKSSDNWKPSEDQMEADFEQAAKHVYESWMGGTMDHFRRDMNELGRVLNSR